MGKTLNKFLIIGFLTFLSTGSANANIKEPGYVDIKNSCGNGFEEARNKARGYFLKKNNKKLKTLVYGSCSSSGHNWWWSVDKDLENLHKKVYKSCTLLSNQSGNGECFLYSVNNKVEWKYDPEKISITLKQRTSKFDLPQVEWTWDGDYRYTQIPSKIGSINVLGYHGVPKADVSDIKKAMQQAAKYLTGKPMVDVYALLWHSSRSDLREVAKDWCAIANKHGAWCLKEGGGFGFDNPDVASGFYQVESSVGLIEGTQGWWNLGKSDSGPVTIAMHEYFHVHQFLLLKSFEDEQRIGIPDGEDIFVPQWIIEGGATYFAINMVGYYGYRDHRVYMSQILDELFDEQIKPALRRGVTLSLKDHETRQSIDKIRAKVDTNMHYQGGAWAHALLAHLNQSNNGVFHSFYKDLAEMERDARSNGRPNTGWKDSFKANFGRSVETFYEEFTDFLSWSKQRKLRILLNAGQ